MLKEVMIYDTSEGFDNMSVFVYDSAMMISLKIKYLLLNLYTGQLTLLISDKLIWHQIQAEQSVLHAIVERTLWRRRLLAHLIVLSEGDG